MQSKLFLEQRKRGKMSEIFCSRTLFYLQAKASIQHTMVQTMPLNGQLLL